MNNMLHEQLRIEQKVLQFVELPFDPRQTVAEVFGEMEEWSFSLGPYELMLNPFNGEWLYWDEVHGTLEGTGWQAGEVIFELGKNDEVTVRRRRGGTNVLAPSGLSETQQRLAALREKYEELRQQLVALKLDAQKFVSQVHELRLQTDDGQWWQLRPEDGVWLLWDGTTWVEAVQPLDWL